MIRSLRHNTFYFYLLSGLTRHIALIVVFVIIFPVNHAFTLEINFVDTTGIIEAVDVDNPGAHGIPKAKVSQKDASSYPNLNFIYQDVINNNGNGFDHAMEGDSRRDVMESVFEYIIEVLNGIESTNIGIGALEALDIETATSLDIKFNTSEMDGSGALVTTGTYYWNSSGFQGGFCYEHITSGEDPEENVADIVCTVDFGYSWYAGENEPSGTQFDLFSVMLHEMTHGLGFFSLTDSAGDSVIFPGTFTLYDKYIETGNGNDCWDDDTAQFIGLAPYLLGGDNGLAFTGPDAILDYGSEPPLYAPGVWDPDLSLKHWNAAQMPFGTVMRPAISLGETQRKYTDLEIAVLRDIGYADAGICSLPALNTIGLIILSVVFIMGGLTILWLRDRSCRPSVM